MRSPWQTLLDQYLEAAMKSTPEESPKDPAEVVVVDAQEEAPKEVKKTTRKRRQQA